jgi:PAS domain S-box-containing protein
LKDIIETMPVGAIAIDEHDNVLHTNQELCRLFSLHLEPADLAGKRGDEVIAIVKAKTEKPEEHLQHARDMLRLRIPSLKEEIRLQDGRILSRDYIPIFVESIYRGHLLLYRDITAEKRADLSKSEFMSLASHQLRTPLTAIRWSMGKLSNLLKEKLPAKEERLLNEAKKAAARMAGTIDTMLMISRIEAGKVTLKPGDVVLHTLFDELKDQYQKMHQEKAQTLRIECDTSLVLSTDLQFLKEILQSLMDNATKYTPHNGTIGLRATKVQDNILIRIEDNGCGIPFHQQDKLFSKFFRGDNVIGKDTNGTGLGLYLVSLLVRLLQGSIQYVSEEHHGTTFTLTFPALLAP